MNSSTEYKNYKCGQCIHWDKEGSIKQGQESTINAKCRRFPPTIKNSQIYDYIKTSFNTEACAEFYQEKNVVKIRGRDKFD